jgi:hypothetical protein
MPVSFQANGLKGKLIVGLSALFLFMAFFQAWEDESVNRKSAESDRATFKDNEMYYAKRFNNLSDAVQTLHLANNPANYSLASSNITRSEILQGIQNSQVALKNNSDNPSVKVGDISGNVAILIGSSNNSFTQSVVALPKPFIISTNIVSINVPDGTTFKSQILLEIGNSRPIPKIKSWMPSTLKSKLKSEPELKFEYWAQGLRKQTGEHVDISCYSLTFSTSERIQASDLSSLTFEVVP